MTLGTTKALTLIMLLTSSPMAMEEKNQSPEGVANKVLVDLLSNEYSSRFEEGIDRYNRARTSVNQISKLFNSENDQKAALKFFHQNLFLS
jgi:hypothetical protein